MDADERACPRRDGLFIKLPCKLSADHWHPLSMNWMPYERTYAYSVTRVMYSPVSVFTFTLSPSLMKSGTFTDTPDSSLAGLDPP